MDDVPETPAYSMRLAVHVPFAMCRKTSGVDQTSETCSARMLAMTGRDQVTAASLLDRLAAHQTVGAAPREELAWLVSHGSLQRLDEGEVLSAKVSRSRASSWC
jgi:hypothetical protein